MKTLFTLCALLMLTATSCSRPEKSVVTIQAGGTDVAESDDLQLDDLDSDDSIADDATNETETPQSTVVDSGVTTLSGMHRTLPVASNVVLDQLLDEIDLPTKLASQDPEKTVSPFDSSETKAKTKTETETETNSEIEQSADAWVEPPVYNPNVQTIEIPDAWKRLGKDHEIWLDPKAKLVIVAGEVCLNRGQLEMFICPQNTKEHESVISVNALASEVHASLIVLGADPGKSASWNPEYRAAFGPVIDVTIMWHDEKTNKTVTQSARKWIRNIRTGKALDQPWVFGGSISSVDPDSGLTYYYGDGGELICLSNFGAATIDLNIESSQSGDSLLFEAFTENIPPVGTKVYAILKPGKRIEPEAKKVDTQGTDSKETDSPESSNSSDRQPSDKEPDSDGGI